jgi:alpha-tubulin suppressor-like RCC1 family protein
MGSNTQGQLGIEDPYIQQKNSPVLIEALLSKKSRDLTSNLEVSQLACGSAHTLALMNNGEVYAWGNNEHG